MITVEQLENYKQMYKPTAPNVPLDLIAEIERLRGTLVDFTNLAIGQTPPSRLLEGVVEMAKSTLSESDQAVNPSQLFASQEQMPSAIFSDMYDLLTQVAEANDGDTVWYNGGTTAHEALIGLAEKYDPGIAKTLEVRLERDCSFLHPDL